MWPCCACSKNARLTSHAGEEGKESKEGEAKPEAPAKDVSEHEQIIAAQLAEIKDITVCRAACRVSSHMRTQDKYKRALAENENVRRRGETEVGRSSRAVRCSWLRSVRAHGIVQGGHVLQVQNAKEFAIQKFCKDIIPVADVLQVPSSCLCLLCLLIATLVLTLTLYRLRLSRFPQRG